MQPVAVIIDSIQTVYLDDVNGSAGSVSQVPRRLFESIDLRKMEGASLAGVRLASSPQAAAPAMQRGCCFPRTGGYSRSRHLTWRCVACLPPGAGVRHGAAACRQAGEDPHLSHRPRHEGAPPLATRVCNFKESSHKC